MRGLSLLFYNLFLPWLIVGFGARWVLMGLTAQIPKVSFSIAGYQDLLQRLFDGSRGTWHEWRDFEIADPFKSPRWFLEDVLLLFEWLVEDFLFPLWWFRVLLFFGLLFCAGIIIYEAHPTMMRVRRCYLEYLDLGRGGRASNVRGWLGHEVLKFMVVNRYGPDIFSKPYRDPYVDPYNGSNLELDDREGDPPVILGIGPMKQENEGNREAEAFFVQGFEDYAARKPDTFQSVHWGVRTGLPTLQLNLRELPPRRWNIGVPTGIDWFPWLGFTVPNLRVALVRHWYTIDSRREHQGEVAHCRPDGSLSVHLHPFDAWQVIRHGWGQRNPLAVMSEVWLWKFISHWIFFRSTHLPSDSVIIYAPMDEDQRNTIARIVGAAVWWAEQPANFPEPENWHANAPGDDPLATMEGREPTMEERIFLADQGYAL